MWLAYVHVCADTVPVLLEASRCPMTLPCSSETRSLTGLELGCFCSPQFSHPMLGLESNMATCSFYKCKWSYSLNHLFRIS